MTTAELRKVDSLAMKLRNAGLTAYTEPDGRGGGLGLRIPASRLEWREDGEGFVICIAK
jgi:hypothetical protein